MSSGYVEIPVRVLPLPSSVVRLSGVSANGDSAPNTPLFDTVATYLGTDITLINDFDLGTLFQINASGLYAMGFSMIDGDLSASIVGFGLNVTPGEIASSPNELPDSMRLTFAFSPLGAVPTNNCPSCSYTGYFKKGDVVRPVTNGTIPSVAYDAYCFITRIA